MPLLFRHPAVYTNTNFLESSLPLSTTKLHCNASVGGPRQGHVEWEGHWAMLPPLRSPNFTLDIGLSQKKVCERRWIGRKTRVGPPPPRAISKHQGRQFLSRSGGYVSRKFTVIRGLFSDLVLYYLMYSLDSSGGMAQY